MTDKMLDIQIVRAITAIGPLTRTQIIDRVGDVKSDVEASLDALVTMGCLRTELNSFKQFEYRLKPNFSERDCKFSVHREKVATYVAKHGSDSKVILPVTSGIKFSEGLDRSIWKAANTGRWMMVREIRDILTSVGFRRSDVVSRIQTLINSGKWFERQSGHHRNQFFMLREGIPCPEVGGMRGHMQSIAFLDDAPFQPVLPAVATESEEFKVASTASIIEPPKPPLGNPLALDAYFPISSLSLDVIEAARSLVLQEVGEQDTLHEAIWKLLRDGEECSCSDLVILLNPLGFTEKQISPLLSKRYADGLLSRRLVQVNGKWVNVYKKAGELPAKFTSNGSVVSDIIEAQAITEVKVAVPEQVEESTSEPTLLAVKIQLKDVELTLHEFKTLYRDLSDAGFTHDMQPEASDPNKPYSLLKSSFNVKGEWFSRAELIVLMKEMHRTANRFKQALFI